MHRIEPGSSSCSCPLMGHCDKPGTGGERINKVDRLTWPGQRYFPYEILIFLCPEPIGFEPAQHVGEHCRRIGRRGPLPSPADVRRGRGEVVQMADDCWIVVGSRPIARTDALGQRAQLVGCSLDWIHARESGDLGRLPLRHGDERADLCATGGSAGA